MPKNAKGSKGRYEKGESSNKSNKKVGVKTPREFHEYELKEFTNEFHTRIGKGASAEVFAGQMQSYEIAVKITKLELDKTNRIDQWRAEKAFYEEVHHPNIVNYFGQMEGDEMMYIVLERMPFALPDKIQDLEWEQIMKILKQVTRGIECIHGHSYVHGDLKTENILLDASYNAKIVDFGSVSKINPKSKEGRIRCFTPRYAPPEASREGKITAKGDVFSFGIILLQLIMKEPQVIIHVRRAPDTTIVAKAEGLLRQNKAAMHKSLKKACSEAVAMDISRLGVRCANKYPNSRPTLEDTIRTLETLEHEPKTNLPSKKKGKN